MNNMSQEGQPPPPPSGLAAIFSEMLIVAGVLLGILLIWIAQLIGIYGTGTDALKIKLVLKGLGVMLSSGALIGGGILNKNIDKLVRFGMVLVAGLLIIATLVIA